MQRMDQPKDDQKNHSSQKQVIRNNPHQKILVLLIKLTNVVKITQKYQITSTTVIKILPIIVHMYKS
jgi:hypothetical protein